MTTMTDDHPVPAAELAGQIDISVSTRYLEEQSDPENNRFAFAYTIGIENRGEQSVQLLSRHWVITDDDEHVEEVRGSGVVGLQPTINPGQRFVYTSGAVLPTEFGTMQGSYDMVTSDGDAFTAEIPAFLLSRPLRVH